MTSTSDSLLDEITTSLSRPSGRDDPARLERILTDGYARALALEVERARLQRRIRALASEVERSDRKGRRELSQLIERLTADDHELGHLRALLLRLRSRYSAAAATGL